MVGEYVFTYMPKLGRST